MNLLDIFADTGGGLAVPGFAGGMFNVDRPLADAAPRGLQFDLPAPAQPRREGGGLFGGGLGNFLGMLGDAFLVGSGGKPMYRERMIEQRRAKALGNYLGRINPALAEIFAADPETGLAILKAEQGKEPPAFVQEYLYRQGLDPQARKDFDAYAERRRFNPYAAPITMGPTDTIEMPGAPTDDAPTATGPNGEKVRWNGTTWEPIAGGPTATPSVPFP